MYLRWTHSRTELLHAEYRTVVNPCRKSVRQDKKEYRKQMSQDLMDDFQKGKLHSAYHRLKLRVDQPTAKALNSGTVRRADGSVATDKSEGAALRREYFNQLLNCRRNVAADVLELLPKPGRPPGIATAAAVDESE